MSPETQAPPPATGASVALPATKSHGQLIVRNSFANFAGQVLTFVLAFAVTPYMTRSLGVDQYGSLMLLMTYLTAFSVLNLGINTSLVKYLSEALATSHHRDFQCYLSTALTVLPASALIVTAPVFVLAGPLAAHLFKGNGQYAPGLAMAIRIASAALVIQFLCQVFSAVLAASQRFDILNAITVVAETGRLLVSTLVLYLGFSLNAVMSVALAVSACTFFAYVGVAKRLAPGLHVRPGFSKRHFLLLIRHSRYVLIGTASNRIVSTADNFMIAYFAPAAGLAYYGIGYGLGEKIWSLVGNVATVLFPAASAFSGTTQPERIRSLYLRGTKMSAAIAVFPAAMLFIFSEEFLLFWLGPDYARGAAFILRLLMVGFALNAFSHVAYQVLQAASYASETAKAATVYSVLNLAMFIALIPRFGVKGAAAGFLSAQVLFVPWFLTRANRLLRTNWNEVLWACYIPVAAVAACSCAIALMLRPGAHSLISLGAIVLLSGVSYCGLAFRFVLNPSDREACRLLFGHADRTLRRNPGLAAGSAEVR